jgi:hypothetical protein
MNIAQDIANYLASQVTADVKPYPPIPWSDSAINSLTVKEVLHWLQFATDKAEISWNGKTLATLLTELPADATLRSLVEVEKREPTDWEKSTKYTTTLGDAIHSYYLQAFNTIRTKWFKDLTLFVELSDTRSPEQKATSKRHFLSGYNEEEKAQYRLEKQAKWRDEGQLARSLKKTLADNPYSSASMKVWWPEGEKYWAEGWNQRS